MEYDADRANVDKVGLWKGISMANGGRLTPLIALYVRAGIHFIGFLIGGITSELLAPEAESFYRGGIIILCMIGFVGLFGRCITEPRFGYYPAIMGLFLTLTLCLLGISFPVALLWGGILSVIQQFYARMHLKVFSNTRPGAGEWQFIPLIILIALIETSDYVAIPPVADTASPWPTLLVATSLATVFFSVLGWPVILKFVQKEHRHQLPARSSKTKSVEFPLEFPEETLPPARKQPPPSESVSISEPFDSETLKRIVASLRSKMNLLSAEHAMPIAGICDSADKILECMESDPLDIPEGNRFLRRYLPQTETLVDQILILQRGGNSEIISQAQAPVIDTLMKLDTAFASQHVALLQNNVHDLKAQIGTLDRLLKMEGR